MTDHNDHTAYRISIDTDACDGIFACLVRDDRFVESEDGLATFDAGEVSANANSEIVAEFDDARQEDAEAAAAACPPGAITVEEVEP